MVMPWIELLVKFRSDSVMTKLITIVVPAYNEEEGIFNFVSELKDQLQKLNHLYTFKLIIVDDGSRDSTLVKLRELRRVDNFISYISLSRNRGKEIALLAGLDHVPPNADAVIIMDADLQHPPEVIPKFLEKWETGVLDVYGKRINRNYESRTKQILSWIYYKAVQFVLQQKIDPGAGDFRLLDRKVLNALTRIRESQRYTKGLYDLVGFNKGSVDFEVPQRTHGVSSWSGLGLLRLAIDGITSYSTLPLRIATMLGFLISLISFLYMSYIVLKTILYGDPVAGYPSLLSIVLFIGGAQLLTIGILGEYVGKMFYESKGRPLYFVAEYES